MVLLLLGLWSLLAVGVDGQGRLVEPPNRSSLWRFGYGTPANYDDNSLNCGGFYQQWSVNGGKCGVCGDPYNGARQHEDGGQYASGIITGNYEEGQVIKTQVLITANHRGWFEFRVCPLQQVSDYKSVEQCLDENVLELADGTGVRYDLGTRRGDITVDLVLPPGVVCKNCLFQWKWQCGNNWGSNARGEGCLGCGPQEEFYGCADIAVQPRGGWDDVTPTPAPSMPSTIKASTTTQSPPLTAAPYTQVCKATGAWVGQQAVDMWCVINCAKGFCPSSHCICARVIPSAGPRTTKSNTNSASSTTSPQALSSTISSATTRSYTPASQPQNTSAAQNVTMTSSGPTRPVNISSWPTAGTPQTRPSNPTSVQTNPSKTTTVPNTSTPQPDPTTTIPSSVQTNPSNSTKVPNTSTPLPEPSTTIPSSVQTNPSNSTKVPNTSVPQPEPSTTIPSSVQTNPSCSTKVPNTSTPQPEPSTTIPSSVQTNPSNSTKVPSTSTPQPEPSTTIPSSVQTNPSYTTKVPNTSPSQPEPSTTIPFSVQTNPSNSTKVPNTITPQPEPSTTIPSSVHTNPSNASAVPNISTPQPEPTVTPSSVPVDPSSDPSNQNNTTTSTFIMTSEKQQNGTSAPTTSCLVYKAINGSQEDFLDSYCQITCNLSPTDCPLDTCECDEDDDGMSATASCPALNIYSDLPHFHQFCTLLCVAGTCDDRYCICD